MITQHKGSHENALFKQVKALKVCVSELNAWSLLSEECGFVAETPCDVEQTIQVHKDGQVSEYDSVNLTLSSCCLDIKKAPDLWRTSLWVQN